MVEPNGLTVGLLSLAGLFSTCIDCFDFYEASNDCGDELRTLLVQLDLAAADPDMRANQGSASERLRRLIEAGTSIATGTTKNTSNSWIMRCRVVTRD
jgi:hypothetical protein